MWTHRTLGNLQRASTCFCNDKYIKKFLRDNKWEVPKGEKRSGGEGSQSSL